MWKKPKQIISMIADLKKGLLESGMIGKEGYDTHLAEHGRRRDETIEGALSTIDTIINEYDSVMADLVRLDGSRIDDNVMKVLNSGMNLSSKDWQMLADENKDNAIMSRILKERYNANPPQEENALRVTFGQSPESRREIFNSFHDQQILSVRYRSYMCAGTDSQSY